MTGLLTVSYNYYKINDVQCFYFICNIFVERVIKFLWPEALKYKKRVWHLILLCLLRGEFDRV